VNVLMDGILFGESIRWHEGQVWFSDWAAGQVIRLEPGGDHEVVLRVESFPLCFDFAPDGSILVVDSAHNRMLRRESGSSTVVHADLSPISEKPWNDIVVDTNGNAYVNNINYDFPGGEPAPGFIARVAPDGFVCIVADDLSFPNGMAINADGTELIVAESHGNRLTAFSIGPGGDLHDRRVWAETGADHPDGICFDADGALWYADVANKHCVRVREGGLVLDCIEMDRGAFDCALSRDGDPKLYVVGQEYRGPQQADPTGIVVEFPAPTGGAGRP
jgi:sugar lactone lactonase YvrE